MCPRQGRDGWGGLRNEDQDNLGSSSIPWKNYWVWRAGEKGEIWLFKPVTVEDLSRLMA